jgi:hypothetical protein
MILSYPKLSYERKTSPGMLTFNYPHEKKGENRSACFLDLIDLIDDNHLSRSYGFSGQTERDCVAKLEITLKQRKKTIGQHRSEGEML